MPDIPLPEESVGSKYYLQLLEWSTHTICYKVHKQLNRNYLDLATRFGVAFLVAFESKNDWSTYLSIHICTKLFRPFFDLFFFQL